jgi:hypothetical protein
MNVPLEIVDHLRAICTALPEVVEEAAWTGTRWRVAKKTFTHVLAIDDGWPPAYARAAASAGPLVVVMFRSSGEELDALRSGGPPFFAPVWRDDEVGMIVDDAVDWQEVTELVTESYRTQAPKRLRTLLPGDDCR